MNIKAVKEECYICGDSYYTYNSVEKKLQRCFAHEGETSFSFADDCEFKEAN